MALSVLLPCLVVELAPLQDQCSTPSSNEDRQWYYQIDLASVATSAFQHRTSGSKEKEYTC